MTADYHQLVTDPVSFAKQAAGKIMEVSCEGLEQDGQPAIKTSRLTVYMPDCSQYRNILKNGTGQEKAELIYKFFLQKAPGMHFSNVSRVYVTEKD